VLAKTQVFKATAILHAWNLVEIGSLRHAIGIVAKPTLPIWRLFIEWVSVHHATTVATVQQRCHRLTASV